MRRARMRIEIALLGLGLMPSLALAQPARPPESVTVTGTKSREVLEKFVGSLATPTRIAGKMVRWQQGICPLTVGLRRSAVTYINRRLKEIATQAGAPVNGRSDCKSNIDIVFTTTPQGLMDWVRQKHPEFLGYHDNSEQADRLATVTRPVQAWYLTATRDYNGRIQTDAHNVGGGGVQIGNVYLPDAKAYAVSGSRLGDGLSSGFYHVIIVIDPNKMVNYEIGTLTDYIAMLALTQPLSLDTCQQLPSIVNMLAQGCDQQVGALTQTDLAYLRGLYKMNADWNLAMQKDEVAYQMERELKGR